MTSLDELESDVTPERDSSFGPVVPSAMRPSFSFWNCSIRFSSFSRSRSAVVSASVFFVVRSSVSTSSSATAPDFKLEASAET